MSTEVFYTQPFKQYIETHLKFLRDHPDTIKRVVEPGLVYKNRFDFYGLLLDMKVPYQYHWLIMRVNGMHDPSEMPAEHLALLVPDTRVIDQLVQLYRANEGRTVSSARRLNAS